MKAIINGKIILEKEILNDHILLFNERIIDIVKSYEIEYPYKFDKVIDAKDKYISPGLIDLHIHGSADSDTMDATFDSLNNISKSITRTGVTSFLPTTMTMSKHDILKALENVKRAMNKKVDGAKIQGVHMEGPFISKKYKGAQNEKYIIKADYEFIKPYLDILKIITIAPEEDESHDFIKRMKRHTNIRLAMGHTNATFEEALKAIDNGVTYITHTFNAMTGFHHREPGVVGAVFSKEVDCELIADTIHVHNGFFQGFIDINKKEKIILVTDSMRAGCMKAGEYELGGQRVIVSSDSARLENGVLAGSILKLNEGVRNILNNTNYSLNDVVNMASLNQAKAIGIDKELGSIKKGKVADLIIFDEEINILKTIIDGEVIFEVIN